MEKQYVRPLAICVFRHKDRILVAECIDPAKNEFFYRPLGGEIEFGERGEQAIAREIREEIDAGITDIRYLGMLENLFIYNGRPGHEIVLVYDARFSDSSFYEREYIDGIEGADMPFRAVWMEFVSLKDPVRLYPAGLYEFLHKDQEPR